MIRTSPCVQKLINYTPLRYPGGKAKLAPFIKRLLMINGLSDGLYVEPYAGGAGIACELLLQEYVSKIHINDISRAVWAFWRSVLNETDSLVRLIHDTRLSVDTWDKQKRILSHSEDHEPLKLGFAAFFLNRTNRSGILNGGIIGGRRQKGPWKIDARYNAVGLVARIEAIASLRSRVSLSNQDAKTLLTRGFSDWPAKTLIYLDPPYYMKGKDLYFDFYGHAEHEEIASLMTCQQRNQTWVVSYDNVPEIRRMYSSCRRITYSLAYSAREARVGTEVMFFCRSLRIPKARPGRVARPTNHSDS